MNHPNCLFKHFISEFFKKSYHRNYHRKQKNYFLNIFICLALFLFSIESVYSAPKGLRIIPTTGRVDKLSQFGITWHFENSVEYGKFINGDYWVVGPVRIVEINPRSFQQSDGRIVNGSMINPKGGLGSQGFDSTQSYNQGLNVAWDLSPAKPLEVSAGTSLISAISDPPNTRPYLLTAAILTVVDSALPEDSFRPGYCDPQKIIYRAGSLMRSEMQNLPPVAGTPTIDQVERLFERPWLDWIPDWVGRDLHPKLNMPDYGREIARDVGIGALMLHIDLPPEQKERLLVRYVQLGIDLFSIVKSGGTKTWPPNGGHASGRKWPIIFAGIMLNNDDMKNIGQKSGDYLDSPGYGPGNPPPDYISFGEDAQTFYVGGAVIDKTLSPDSRDAEVHYYVASDSGFPEWGIRYALSPLRSNKYFQTYYRLIAAATWEGFTTAARIMGAETYWNHPALFDYVDRHLTIIVNGEDFYFSLDGKPLQLWKVPGETTNENQPISTFTRNMWKAYW